MTTNQSDENSHTINAAHIPCKECGATLVYDPETGSLKCDHCLTTIEIDQTSREVIETDYATLLIEHEKERKNYQVLVVECSSCGAKTTFDPHIVSDYCSFCGVPMVAKEGSSDTIIKPGYLLPFKVSEEQATTNYNNWIRKMKFTPFGFKNRIKDIAKLTSTYLPFWTFDLDVLCEFTGVNAQKNYLNDKNIEKEFLEYERIKLGKVRGKYKHLFDDLLIPASKALPAKYLQKLEPWKLDNLVTFDEKYLSGIRTESSQLEIQKGYRIAMEIVKKQIKKMLTGKLWRLGKHLDSASLDPINVSFKNLLLPVWISAFRYNNKTYRISINAVTGEVQGERPFSILKIILLFLGITSVGVLYILFIRSRIF